MMCDVFVVVAHPVDEGDPVVEVGSASSYGGASELVRLLARNPEAVRGVSWFGVEGRCRV